jgi:hypothetical protein
MRRSLCIAGTWPRGAQADARGAAQVLDRCAQPDSLVVRRRYLIVVPSPIRTLRVEGTWSLRPAVARGAARCATQVLDRDA